MNRTSLTDDHIDAILGALPESMRTEVGNELRTSIDRKITMRASNGDPLEVAERATLAEFGLMPDSAAENLSHHYLVGPRYYSAWRQVLELLIAIVVPIAAIGGIAGAVSAGSDAVDALVQAGFAIASGLLHVTFWTTLVFVIVERIRPDSVVALSPRATSESRDDSGKSPSLRETVSALILLAIAAGVVVWDVVIGFAPSGSDSANARVSFLNPGLWPWWIVGFLALLTLAGLVRVLAYRAGRWTPGLAVVSALIAIAISASAIILLLNGDLLNPAYFTDVAPGHSETAENVLGSVTGVAIVASAVWEIVRITLKSIRGRG